jgi:hypothetical protein
VNKKFKNARKFASYLIKGAKYSALCVISLPFLPAVGFFILWDWVWEHLGFLCDEVEAFPPEVDCSLEARWLLHVYKELLVEEDLRG